MKKHDEGYALAFVLVVMLVLCLVAVTVLSYSLDNLRQQKIAAQRMEDQYIAQGMIEQLVALLEKAEITVEGSSNFDPMFAKDEDRTDSGIQCTPRNTGDAIEIVSYSGGVSISCVLIVTDGQNGVTITYESYTIEEVTTDG